MIYVSVPKKVKIENKSEIEQYNKIIALFARHGLGIAHFSNRGVSFYNASDCDRNYVPMDKLYKLSKQEFVAFVELVKRLDESENRLSEMVRFVNGAS